MPRKYYEEKKCDFVDANRNRARGRPPPLQNIPLSPLVPIPDRNVSAVYVIVAVVRSLLYKSNMIVMNSFLPFSILWCFLPPPIQSYPSSIGIFSQQLEMAILLIMFASRKTTQDKYSTILREVIVVCKYHSDFQKKEPTLSGTRNNQTTKTKRLRIADWQCQ